MNQPFAIMFGIVATCGLATSAIAGEFYDFIDYSEGYVNIRPDVVLVEGEEDIMICKFSASDALFSAYAAGDMAAFDANRADPICVPLSLVAVAAPHEGLMNSFDLHRFVDNSESYEQIRTDVVMIEGERDIKLCKFDVSDALFSAFEANDMAAIEANRPSVICIPLGEVVN